MPHPRVYGIPSPHSPATPGENWVAADFNFDDASPKKLFTIPVNYRIITCQIVIETPFDDDTATLTVGTLAEFDKFMAADQNEPTVIGENESNPYLLTTVDTDIYITINPAAAVQGIGTVLLEFDQPFP